MIKFGRGTMEESKPTTSCQLVKTQIPIIQSINDSAETQHNQPTVT